MTQRSGIHNSLKNIILEAIKKIDNPQYIPDEEVEWMADKLAHFVLASIEKYRRGTKEHGPNFEAADAFHELEMEIMDLLWYFFLATETYRRKHTYERIRRTK